MANVIVAGLDLGTNTTVLVTQQPGKGKKSDKPAAAAASVGAKVDEGKVTFRNEVDGAEEIVLDGMPVSEVVFRSVVGIPKQTILPGILPRGKKPLFGEEALKYKMHCDLHWPVEGTVVDADHARLLVGAIRDMLDADRKNEVRMVIGSPANATSKELRSIRAAMAGTVDKILIVPEPFLAAMGYRDEARLGTPDYHDPVVNTLFVDIGAGTTDLCKVQGYYPTEDDLISINVAGNYVDKKLRKHIEKTYPDVRLSDTSVTQLKEDHSYVGGSKSNVEVKVPVHGKHKTLDITNALRESCEAIVEPIVEKIEEMAQRCDPEAVEEMLANITLTGGGSQIKGIDKMIEKTLQDRDYLSAKVTIVDNYKPLVARGAIKTGLKLKDDQWSVPM